MAPNTKTSTINSPVQPVLPGWPPPRSRSAGIPRHGPSRRSPVLVEGRTSSGQPGCTWRRPGPSSCIPRKSAQPEAILDRRDELLVGLGLQLLPVAAGLASDRGDHAPELLNHFHLCHSFLLIDHGRGHGGFTEGLLSEPQQGQSTFCGTVNSFMTEYSTIGGLRISRSSLLVFSSGSSETQYPNR